MKYASKIAESVEYLQEAERKRGRAQDRDRLRFLRLLKSGEARSQAAAGAAIGLCERHSQRLWHIYQTGGLEALMKKPVRRSWGKLDSFQISQLRQYLLDNQAQTLADIQAYLAGSLGVQYTIGGASDLCKRLKIKRKRGRPVHVQQQPGAIDSFKKSGQS